MAEINGRKRGEKKRDGAKGGEKMITGIVRGLHTWCVLLRHAMLHFAQREEASVRARGGPLISQPRTRRR